MSNPELLYKYRNWGKPWQRQILTIPSVYYAYTAQFEDEYDCHPRTIPPTIQDLYDYSVKYHLGDTPAMHQQFAQERWTFYQNEDPKVREKRVREMERKHDNYFGVLCLSFRPNNQYLWKCNSSDHNGFCVEFDAEKLLDNIPKGVWGPVEYCETIPETPSGVSSNEYMKTTYLHKSKMNNMPKEEEYRIVKHYAEVWTRRQRNVLIPPQCIKKVYVDNKMSKNYRTEIDGCSKGKWDVVPIEIDIETENEDNWLNIF